MTVWQEFTPLAKETGAVNLGQGFPDWETPRFVKDALIRALEENHNQYARSAGQPALVQAIASRLVAKILWILFALDAVKICHRECAMHSSDSVCRGSCDNRKAVSSSNMQLYKLPRCTRTQSRHIRWLLSLDRLARNSSRLGCNRNSR